MHALAVDHGSCVCTVRGGGRGRVDQNDQVRKNVEEKMLAQTHFLTSPPGRQKKYFGVRGGGSLGPGRQSGARGLLLGICTDRIQTLSSCSTHQGLPEYATLVPKCTCMPSQWTMGGACALCAAMVGGWVGQYDQVRKNVDISDFRQTHFLTSPPGRQKKYFGVIGRGLRARLVGGHTGTRPPIWRARLTRWCMGGQVSNYGIM
jgi:hypothetical protein